MGTWRLEHMGTLGHAVLATADCTHMGTAATFGTCGLGTAHCVGTPSPLGLDTDAWGNVVSGTWGPRDIQEMA